MSVVENFKSLQKDVNNIFDDFFIPSKATQIIAISKRKPIGDIIPLLEYGHRIFGENKLQEAAEKWPDLKAKYPDIELHMVGAMQSNKLKPACVLFDVLQNIDRLSLLQGLLKIRNQGQKLPKIMLQVNLGDEPQKSGCSVKDLEALIAFCTNNDISIYGLMCIPPQSEISVYYFVKLKNLSIKYNIPMTSMGMSDDYPQALICQTDYIRIGTKIFRNRDL